MRIIRTADYKDMSRKAGNLILAQVAQNPNSVLGLATGSSPLGAYARVIHWFEKGDVDFTNVKAVNLDEYVGLGAGNDQSYAYFMRENLFKHINIKPENTNIPNGLEADAAKECARYDEVIRTCGGVDLQLLGLGQNGHIGFNEPSDIFPKGTHCVGLTESTINANMRFFASANDVPRKAYTMGIGGIMGAKQILIIASGKGKAEAVKQAFFGPITPQLPASVLQLHPHVTLVADEEALSLI